jgi:hypothetical protein
MTVPSATTHLASRYNVRITTGKFVLYWAATIAYYYTP